jgi:DNA-binding NarL/FixJ family response regulator
MTKRILIVEDEAAVRRAIRTFLEHHHYEICGEAANGAEALERPPLCIPTSLPLTSPCLE